MTASEAYDRYLLKAEKNSTNDGISTDKRRFCELYNEYQNRYVEYVYDLKNEDEFRYIESLLVLSHQLDDFIKKRDFYSFNLPSDYFELSSVYALGSKGDCKNKRIDLPIEATDINIGYYLMDEFTKPSFEYRESIYTIASNSVNVYVSDFDIKSVILSYYRYPKQIMLQNPDNPESDFVDMELDFDEKVINRIITASVMGYDINNDSSRWQINNGLSKKEL